MRCLAYVQVEGYRSSDLMLYLGKVPVGSKLELGEISGLRLRDQQFGPTHIRT